MTPRDLRRLMTGLINIEREELEAIGVIQAGERGDEALREFWVSPVRAVLRLTNDQQQALLDHFCTPNRPPIQQPDRQPQEHGRE